MTDFRNPFRPGAGHMPPYLAGRNPEIDNFKEIIKQDIILDNMVLTGLRGVGKTVLLETLKPVAIQSGWWWVGTDLSESASVSEDNIAIRLLTDLSVVTSNIVMGKQELRRIGFTDSSETCDITLNYSLLQDIYNRTPGLVADKLKRILNLVSEAIKPLHKNGIIFAYDEAQNLSDQDQKGQYPLSLLLDVFQSIQRSDIPFMLLFSGLPTLFPKLVEARTFAERMFRVIFLDRLNDKDSKDAILKPIEVDNCPIKLTEKSVESILSISKGYPYFIQFICREAYDAFIQNISGSVNSGIPVEEILRKLDSDFFAGRWAKATDRQRELLTVIAQLDNAVTEFTVQEIVDLSKKIANKPFSNSHVNQMLLSLFKAGLIYKNRYGKYSFAVPLINEFILRQMQ
jgi:hypothetical protein